MKYRLVVASFISVFALSGCFEILRGVNKDEAVAASAAEAARGSAEEKRTAADTARDKTIAQASSNLGPIADVVALRGQPSLANAAKIQKDSIDRALNLPATQYPSPTVTAADLIKDAEASLAKYRTQVSVLENDLIQKNAAADAAERKAIEAEAVARAEKEKADAAARREWWWQIGSSVVGFLVVAAGIAARLGLPYASIVESVLGFINPIAKARRATAETGLAAADVGRQAVSAVETLISTKDPQLAAKMASLVSSATGGQTDSISDVFKIAARAYVVDNHGTQVQKVDSMLSDLRGRVIATTGGVADTVSAVVRA